jgi:hypothetical protein
MLRLEASWQAADDNKQRLVDKTTQETVFPFYISNKKRKNDTIENVSSSDDDYDDQQKAMLLKMKTKKRRGQKNWNRMRPLWRVLYLALQRPISWPI